MKYRQTDQRLKFTCDLKSKYGFMLFPRDYLVESHDKPFFMALGLWRPHTPFVAPKRFFDLYKPEDIVTPPPGWKEDDLDDVPAEGHRLSRIWGERWDQTGASNPGDWNKLLHGYAANTSFAD